jgi:hypothetical protein
MMFALFQSYWRRIAGRVRTAPQLRARHVGICFESLESRCLLSLAPPTIPLIADGFRPALNSGADSAAWSGDSSDSMANSARSLDRGAGAETYPSENLARPISPAPTLPALPYENVPSSTPPDDDSYSSSPDSSSPDNPLAGGLIDIGKSSEFQSSPLNSAELAGPKSETHDVLDMLSTLNYVPSKQATKESVSPSLTPLSSTETEPLSSPDALGAAKARATTDDDNIVLQRYPLAESSPETTFSAAAIDALLEIPAKIESVQSAFQAFEVSAEANVPLPVVPASLERPANDFHPPATDIGLTVGGNSALPSTVLSPIAGPSISSAVESTLDAATAAIERPLGAIDDLTIFDRRLDVITATLITALLGRAVWKLSTESADERELTPATSKIGPTPSREPIRRCIFGCTILEPRG